jgi:hypothetical protein
MGRGETSSLSLIRVIASRTFFAIGVLTTLSLVLISFSGVIISLSQRLIHGSQVEFQGHILQMPLLWRQDQEGRVRGLNLSRAMIGTWVTDPFAIESQSHDGAGVVDQAGALLWQQNTLRKLNAESHLVHYRGDVLHSGSMTFFCVEDDQVDLPTGMVCKASGTSWYVMYNGKPAYLIEVKGMLESIK